MVAGYVTGVALILAALLPFGADASREAVEPESMHVLELALPQRAVTSDEAGSETSSHSAASAAAADAGEDAHWQLVEVQRGDTLGAIFTRLGISHALMHRFLNHSATTKGMARLRPGQELAFLIPGDGDLRAVRFDRDEATRVMVELEAGTMVERLIERPIERRIQFAQATIESSLFDAGQQAGMSDPLIMRMAQVLGFDIDFALDLRRGDSFAVIYDEVYRDGELLRGGDIIAVTFINRGKRFDAIRHTLANGQVDYYAADGRPLRRAFIRTPVDFTRISSRFSLGRQHPILGRMRAHRGVDYAAPTGTPIKAAGNGRVTLRGPNGGYGNTVIIEHGNRITTLYAHLSRFAPNIRVGSRVQQGQTIGYVGMTGLATGPHLHYEFRVNGAHRDPLSIDLPAADPLNPSEMTRFRQNAAPLLARLELLHGTQVAVGP
ncbi:MAG TPA: peptidoglycan DD-metalloendopeptidase family protein [Xanthomonadaceae bacterium]|nr:peptidoglycan DD-metalloendopeptidase family protein [Xanthomonadaceae bacterium]